MANNNLWKKREDLISRGWFYFRNSSLINYLLYKETNYFFNKYIKKWDSLLDLWAWKLSYKNLVLEYTSHYESIDFTKTHKDLDYIWTTSKTWLKSWSFDIVFCSQVLEHVSDPEESFIEISRILKEDGMAIISTPFLWWIHMEPYDFFRYTKYALKKFSHNTWFKILELKEVWWLFCFLISNIGFILNSTFFSIPILGQFIFFINIILNTVFYILDIIFWMKKIFPATYVLVIKKSHG